MSSAVARAAIGGVGDDHTFTCGKAISLHHDLSVKMRKRIVTS